MTTIKNQASNPALKHGNNGTWFGGGTYARAAAHASLPRPWAWVGTDAGQIVTTRSNDIVAGRYYAITVSIRAVTAQAGSMGIDWRNGVGGYLSTTDAAGSDDGEFNMTAATTGRFGFVALAPVDAVRGDVTVNNLEAGGVQATAVMIREALTLVDAEAMLAVDLSPANYADGDSTGGSWDSFNGESPSTIIRDEPASGEALFGPLAAFGTATGVYQAVGEALFGGLFASSGLIPLAAYEPARGRIRIAVTGLDTRVVRIVVYSRPLGTGRWSVVRGGKVATIDGVLPRPVDDYEYRAGGGMEYRIDGLASLENQPEDVVQSVITTVADTEAQVWLKFIPAPWTNIPVELVVDDWELAQDAKSEVHEIQGDALPIVVSDVHSSTRTTVRFRTGTDAQLAALRSALGQGAPAYLQVPDDIPFPTMYVSIGRFRSARWGGRESRRYLTSVEVIQVAAPPPSVIPSDITWEILALQFETWEDVADTFDTWQDVVG